ncbi:MAG: PorV/PorQ family protein [bacterium]
MLKSVIIIFCLIMHAPGFVSYGEGTTSFSFLETGFGAKPRSMGSAYTAVSGDIYSLYWNPAGISDLKRPVFHLGYFNYLLDIQFGFAAAVFNLEKIGSFGLSINYLDGGEFTEINAEQEKISNFSFNTTAICLSSARQITPQLSAGLTIKGVGSYCLGLSMFGIGMDLGFNYKPRIKGLSTALVVKDIGYVFNGFAGQPVNSDFPFPLTCKFGVAYYFRNLPNLLAAADFILPQRGNWDCRIGLDYKFDNMISVRGGYRLNQNRLKYIKENFSSNKTDFIYNDINSWSAGFGLKFLRNVFDFSVIRTVFGPPNSLLFEASFILKI